MAQRLWFGYDSLNYIAPSDDEEETVPDVVMSTDGTEATAYPCRKEVMIAVNALQLNNEEVWVNYDWLAIGDANEGWIGQKDEEEHMWSVANVWTCDWQHQCSEKIAECIEDLEDRVYFNTDMHMQRFEKMKVTEVSFLKHAYSLPVEVFGKTFADFCNKKKLPIKWIRDGDPDCWALWEMEDTMEDLKPNWYNAVKKRFKTREAVEECLAPSSDEDEDSLFSRDSHY